MITSMSRAAKTAWGVLAYNIGVILWGAYVRATGSGAGCGAHWPLCNGVIIQRAPSVATLIEYSHRITSGLALVSVLVLAWITWRATRKGDPARTAAALSVFFMLTEAAVGAGLVLFELVAGDASAARALFMAVHLLNTFILLGCLSMTAWWLSGGARWTLGGRGARLTGILTGCAGILIASSSGAVAALGDTLYPTSSLAAGLRADLSPTSHALIRLRVIHPMFAAAVALGLVLGAPRLARGAGRAGTLLGRLVPMFAALQIAFGIVNVLLLAPIWMQMVHLLTADLVWMTFVLLGAASLGPPQAVRAVKAA